MLHRYGLTRRQFAAAGTAAFAIATVPVALSISEAPLIPYRAIYDERFELARRFARNADSRGWITRAIRGDVTQIWFHDLAIRWQRGPAPIAGFTTQQSLFILERLAWDVGMRVTERKTDPTTNLVRWLIRLPDAGDPKL